MQKTVAISVTAGLATLAAISLWKARYLTFIFDDWDVLLGHYDGNYLTPLNGHLIVVPVLIYQALLHVFGLGSYYPFLVVGTTMFLAAPATFYLVHRRLASPLLVGFIALLYAWSKPAMPSLFYPFLIDFDIPLVCLLVALHLTEADRRSKDLVAAALVAIALGSSGVGDVGVAAGPLDGCRGTRCRRGATPVSRGDRGDGSQDEPGSGVHPSRAGDERPSLRRPGRSIRPCCWRRPVRGPRGRDESGRRGRLDDR